MTTEQKLSISLLNEILKTVNQSRQFAEYKLKYLTPINPNSIKEIQQFEAMRDKCQFRINQIANCITWLRSQDFETT
jgi:hypothetical protein